MIPDKRHNMTTKSTQGKTAKEMTAWFIIVLILTMPFYSAQTLAATVKITQNSGRDNIQGFVNAHGDVWTIEALITGFLGETVTTDQMQITLGGRTDTFETCSSTSTGGATCEYNSDLSAGVSEDTYTFEVKYLPENNANGDSITADGTAPVITGLTAQQTGQDVLVDFSVEDPGSGVGLQEIQIIDVITHQILETYTDFTDADRTFHYAADFGTEGTFNPAGYLTGEERKGIKVRAIDRFGHESTSAAKYFNIDFVKPILVDSSLNFTSLGEFMGITPLVTRMSIDIIETGDLEVGQVTAESDVVDFISANPNTCSPEPTEEEENLWTCTWDRVLVDPVADVPVRFTIKDESGNEVSRTVTKTFVLDTQPPQVEFFGTPQTYEGESYINSGSDKRVILKVREQGVGIDLEKIDSGSESPIVINLAHLGLGDNVLPTSCENYEGLVECNFTMPNVVLAGQEEVVIGIKRLTDKVGNEGPHESKVVKVDSISPLINWWEVYGVGSDGEEKEFYQSGDHLRLRMNISEARSGVQLKVDMNGLVMGAEDVIPPTEEGLLGWEVFGDENCVKQGSTWLCQFDSAYALKSEYQSHAPITLQLQDTAGNTPLAWALPRRGTFEVLRTAGAFTFEKLDVADDPNPDYWSSRARSLTPQTEFVDLDVARFTPSRIPIRIELSSETSQALVRDVQLHGVCEASEENSPLLSRVLIYGGSAAEGLVNPTIQLVAEFAPFEAREIFTFDPAGENFEYEEREYKCQLRISTEYRRKAISTPEVEEITFKVPFAYSDLGARDESLADLIKSEKEYAMSGFWGTIGDLESALKWVLYIARLIDMLTTAIKIINVAIGDSTAFDVLGVTKPAGVATCLGLESGINALKETNDLFSVPVALLTCSKNTNLGWYNKYVTGIVDLYNAKLDSAIDEGLFYCDDERKSCPFQVAGSVYDNIYLSVASVCLPGIVHNLDKFRQILCRKVYCLENDVAAGIATVESCDQLYKLLRCKYFVGELWSLIPFSQFYDQILTFLNNVIRDPLVVAETSLKAICAVQCAISGSTTAICNTIQYIWDIVGFVEDAIGSVQAIISDLESGGLQYCDMLLEEEEVPEVPEESRTTADLESATAEQSREAEA
ncbi:MAG TPA: hypothetical protein VJI15_01280 [Candidatus Nanoarchaeia archaeon]|nr:hypothetical protein [Candidatus Nanoarchaeia archaeon]